MERQRGPLRAAPCQVPCPGCLAPRHVLSPHAPRLAGLPTSDPLRVYTNFIASWDSRMRNPKWVIEHITRDKLKGEGTR